MTNKSDIEALLDEMKEIYPDAEKGNLISFTGKSTSQSINLNGNMYLNIENGEYYLSYRSKPYFTYISETRTKDKNKILAVLRAIAETEKE